MIEICGDLVWDLPCVQQASYLEGVPLMWMLPLYLHVNQKSDYDDDDMIIHNTAPISNLIRDSLLKRYIMLLHSVAPCYINKKLIFKW